MEQPGEERLSQIARTQIPSSLLNFCTIDRNYRTTLEATPFHYPELAPIDTRYIHKEELQFNHWPADPSIGEQEDEEMVVAEQTVRAYYPRGLEQGDLFS